MKHKHHGKKTFRQFFWRRFLILFFGINLIAFALLVYCYYNFCKSVYQDEPNWDIYEEMLNEDDPKEDPVRLLQSCALSFQDSGSQCGVMLP